MLRSSWELLRLFSPGTPVPCIFSLIFPLLMWGISTPDFVAWGMRIWPLENLKLTQGLWLGTGWGGWRCWRFELNGTISIFCLEIRRIRQTQISDLVYHQVLAMVMFHFFISLLYFKSIFMKLTHCFMQKILVTSLTETITLNSICCDRRWYKVCSSILHIINWWIDI